MYDKQADEHRWSQWMRQAQQGDKAAYEALLRELAPVIRSYLIARFGTFDIVDDCVQEALLAIHTGRHSYDPARPFRAWLFAIVRHRTIDMLRRSRPGHRHTPASEEQTGQAPAMTMEAASSPDPGIEIDGARLLGQLSSNLAQALVMTKFLGMSTAECAHQLAVSESVVKVRVHRGLRKLRALWHAEQ